ncbi:hypothetical protein ACHAXM_006083 [Skeletonema potamos]
MMHEEAAERTPPSVSLRKRPRGTGPPSLQTTNSSWAQDENSEIISFITNAAENSPPSRKGGRSLIVGGGGGGDNTRYEYYYDDTNEYSFDCAFGTEEEDGIWMNRNDPPGTILSAFVWVFILYSAVTITLLAESNHLAYILAYFYNTICALALASHAKTMFTDPGAVPQCAVPIDAAARQAETHSMCRTCKSYKPPGSHHCRICNRCVSRMDHHCPWMNNCVGATNLKSFILFLVYTWIGSAMALMIFGCNYFFCNKESCEFTGVLVQLVRIMTVICIGSLLFTSSMLMNITYGIMTGIGTIDRLKKKATNTMGYSAEEPISLEDVFGMNRNITWILPIEPMLPDYDRVVGYSMPQRLLREGGDNTSIC